MLLCTSEISPKIGNVIRKEIKETIKKENFNSIAKIESFQESIEFYSKKIDKYTTRLVNNLQEENKSLKRIYQKI